MQRGVGFFGILPLVPAAKDQLGQQTGQQSGGQLDAEQPEQVFPVSPGCQQHGESLVA